MTLHMSLVQFVICFSCQFCRMAKMESVQYFQFDSSGNMYIFAPGAECTGETKLVKPGNKLIFSSSEFWDLRALINAMYANPENTLASMCTAGEFTTTPCQFKPPLSEDALVDLSHKNFSTETMKKVHWVRKMY